MTKTGRRLFNELLQDEDFRKLVYGDELRDGGNRFLPGVRFPRDSRGRNTGGPIGEVAIVDDEEKDDSWREGVRPKSDAFFLAVQASPPPCTGCPFYARCRDERLACLEFAQWADRDFLRKEPGRIKRAEQSTPDAPYVWVHDELYPPMTPEAWAEESRRLDHAVANGLMRAGRPSPLTPQLATASVKRS